MAVIDSAELLLQASNYDGSGDWEDEANAHDAQLGSDAGADSNDPTFLDYDTDGIQYIYLAAVSGNYASSPDSDATSITGDIDVRARITPDDWTPADRQVVVGRRTTGGNQSSYSLGINADGDIRFYFSPDGSTNVPVESTVGVSQADKLWIRATMDVDNGASGYDVTFYTGGSAATPVWVQLGDVVTTATATAIHAGTAVMEIGSMNAGTFRIFSGKIYRVQVYDGINGTLVYDANFANATSPFASFAESSSEGATVTINRTATGKKSTIVDQNMFLLGTDDYFEIADDAGLDFTQAEDITVMVLGRSYDVSPAADSALLAKKAAIGVGAGYVAYLESANAFGKFMIGAAATSAEDTSPTLTSGVQFNLAGVRNTTDDDIEAFADGVGSGTPTTDNSTATQANNEVLRIGRLSGAGENYFDGEIHAVVLWRSALSDADLATAANELLGIFATGGLFGNTNVAGSGQVLKTGT